MRTVLRIVAAVLVSMAALFASAAPLYPDASRAAGDIEAALKEAAKSNKRVLVDFGGDWCTDCKVLDRYFHSEECAKLLDAHYVLVHVNVGEKGIDRNFDIAERYGIPLKKGVPALAVLESDGRLVHSQKQGEFESMRRMDVASVRDFLVRWKKS